MAMLETHWNYKVYIELMFADLCDVTDRHGYQTEYGESAV